MFSSNKTQQIQFDYITSQQSSAFQLLFRKYDRDQSRADNSSAGSNHDSKSKHHISCHHNPSESTRQYTNKRKKVSEATPKIVGPKIDPSPVETVTEDNIDLCLDSVPNSGPGAVQSSMPSTVHSAAATPIPGPSLVPIQKSRKIDRLHQLRERNKNDKLYQLGKSRRNN